MFKNKYGNFLTVVLIIVIIAIVGLLGYFGYSFFVKSSKDNAAKQAISEFDKVVIENEEKNGDKEEGEIGDAELQPVDSSSTTQKNNKAYMDKYEILGTIKIPKTGVEYPILSEVTTKSLELSVAVLYPTVTETENPLNKANNTVIVGHNYRNGAFFSNNKKLSNGDQIIIKDAEGQSVTYVIYNMYQTTQEDSDYIIRDTGGAREISLSTCTDDSKGRLIIWAKEQQES